MLDVLVKPLQSTLHTASEAALRRQVLAVETERNEQRRGISWQFTSCDARRKLERLYPVKEAEAV